MMKASTPAPGRGRKERRQRKKLSQPSDSLGHPGLQGAPGRAEMPVLRARLPRPSDSAASPLRGRRVLAEGVWVARPGLTSDDGHRSPSLRPVCVCSEVRLNVVPDSGESEVQGKARPDRSQGDPFGAEGTASYVANTKREGPRVRQTACLGTDLGESAFCSPASTGSHDRVLLTKQVQLGR